jgi:hypothetical protein
MKKLSPWSRIFLIGSIVCYCAYMASMPFVMGPFVRSRLLYATVIVLALAGFYGGAICLVSFIISEIRNRRRR